jgi:hypothetical protein
VASLSRDDFKFIDFGSYRSSISLWTQKITRWAAAASSRHGTEMYLL